MDLDPREVCCVCEEPATQRLGGREYCEAHYQRALRPNRSLVRTVITMVIGLLAFAAVVWALTGGLSGQALPLARETRFAASLLLSILPAAAWLWFFYSQDRLEPEPRHYVLAVFLLAGLLTEVLTRFVSDAYALGEWLPADTTSLILGSILVKGFLYSFIVWLVVRYTVYPTIEFDERMDGIVYGTAAGLGVATMLNLSYAVESGGLLLAPGVVNVVVTALAQASFGGLIGFFLGEAKFIDEPVWWLPGGVVLASVLNGLFLWQAVAVRQAGTSVNEINALILAGVVAILTFAALILLMRRAIARTLAGSGQAG